MKNQVIEQKTLNNTIVKIAMGSNKSKKEYANNILIVYADIIRMKNQNNSIKQTKRYYDGMPLSYQIEHAKDMQKLNFIYNQNMISIADNMKQLKNKLIIGNISKSDIQTVFELSEQQTELILNQLFKNDDLKTNFDEPLADDLQQIKNDIRLKAFEYYGILLNTDKSIKSREKKLSAYIDGLKKQYGINKTTWDCYTKADHDFTMFLNDLQEQNKKSGLWNFEPDTDDSPEN